MNYFGFLTKSDGLEWDCGEQGALPARMGKADRRRERFREMAGSCVSVSLAARSWKSTRKKNNAEIWRAVLCRPMRSVKIHLWGTAITGRRLVFLKQRDYPSDYG